MHKLLFVFFLIIVSGFSFSQNSLKSDSLINLLKNQKNDTTKVKTLIKISEEYYLSNLQKSLEYAEQALKLSEILNWKRGMGMSYSRIGFAYDSQGNFSAAFDARQKELKVWEELGSKIGICAALGVLGVSYSDQGNYSKALEYYLQSLNLAEETGFTERVIANLCNIGSLHNAQGNLDKALEYYFKSLTIAQDNGYEQLVADNQSNIGNIYGSKGDYSKALDYFFNSLSKYERLGDKGNYAALLSNIGGMYILQSDSSVSAGNPEYANNKNILALEYFSKALKGAEEIGNKYYETNFLGNIGAIHLKEKNMKEAKKYLQKSLDMAEEIQALDEMQNGYKRHYEYFKALHHNDKALTYYEKYTHLKDSLFNESNKKNISELQIKYETEKKEQENKILTQQNKVKSLQISNHRYLISGLAVLLILILFISSLLYRQNKLKTERLAAQFEQKLLRTQMNPHFIFNTLASIESFIYEHQPKEAGVYLSRFARLIRLILENSASEYITLEKEIEILNYYLSLEKLRLNDNLEYTIEVDNSIIPDQIYLPSMLTQPFIENAIEHGFRGLKEQGIIKVLFSLTGNNLLVQITDNGIGIVQAQQQKDLHKIHKSMAMKITQERLKILNKSKKQKLFFTVTDTLNEQQENIGTKVIFSIPV